MPRGGYRPGAGRRPGSLNVATLERRLRARQGLQMALDGGWLPLDILLAKMRNQPLPDGSHVDDGQFQAAIAAAPYIHARLASSDVRLESDNTHRVVSDAPLSVDEWQAQFAAQHANDAVTSEQVADESEAAG